MLSKSVYDAEIAGLTVPVLPRKLDVFFSQVQSLVALSSRFLAKSFARMGRATRLWEGLQGCGKDYKAPVLFSEKETTKSFLLRGRATRLVGCWVFIKNKSGKQELNLSRS